MPLTNAGLRTGSEALGQEYETIPDTLPASSTTGEKRVFAALARLPDDCLIYYEPVVRRKRSPDPLLPSLS
jgi:hypothetical protein